MKIPFTKLHGAKNDFLITPAAEVPITDLQELAIAICNRHTGIGADGWMILDDTDGRNTGGQNYDATLRLFNSDGSEPELSGNGTRCAALLLARNKSDRDSIRIRTGAGIKELRTITRNHDREFLFEMNMGNVVVVEDHAKVHGLDAVILDVGNPQCAIPVDDFDFDWRSDGAAIERDPRFPKRTNVSFLRQVDRHTIEVRFWERGAGETNSSGTGSTGAAMAAVARGIAESPVSVLTPAGPLQLRFEPEAWLTGPAEYVGEGYFHYGKIVP
ncbi:MAG TPA: diaminopimelate epimerase [Bryobacteraceae bacterium]|jgi:diaminopimelate epimerase|nr:diaminopimelate epimerase [Bryobacteraceae bacterium]